MNVGHLFVLGIYDSETYKVTNGEWSYTQPAWSRDGTQLFAYQHRKTEAHKFGDIVVIQLQD